MNVLKHLTSDYLRNKLGYAALRGPRSQLHQR